MNPDLRLAVFEEFFMRIAEVKKPANAIRLALLLMLLPGMAARVQAERLPIKTYTTADGLGSSAIGYVMAASRSGYYRLSGGSGGSSHRQWC